MKKRILNLTMVSMIAAALLAGCAGYIPIPVPGESSQEAVSEESVSENENGTQIGNPWRETDEAGISEALNAMFIIPEGATDVHYSIMDEELLVQADFSLDGLDYTARMKRSEEFEDISGCYYKWDVDDEGDIFGSPSRSMRYLGDDETVDVFLWRDEAEGLMFSLATSAEDLDGFDIQAIAEQMYQPSFGGFMPSDFLQEKTGKDVYASYDEVISELEKGQGYAFVTLSGYDGDVLLITDYVYDNLDGNMATIQANVYADYDGAVTNIGNVFTQGTAYPIACEDGLLYLGGNHSYETDWISSENHSIMVKDYIFEDFDSEGKSSYSGFLRETPDYDHDEDVTDENGEALFRELTEECLNKKIVNFTVVE